MTQLTFSDVEMGMGRKRETRRSRFLDRLSESCPWDAWLALVREARKADAGARGADPAMGRPRVDDLVPPRMHAARVCFGLSDREREGQAWDPATTRPFVGVAPPGVPDATTPREFRHPPGRRGVGEAMVPSAFGSAADGGLAAGRRPPGQEGAGPALRTRARGGRGRRDGRAALGAHGRRERPRPGPRPRARG